jgi:hypothetical protein
MSGCVLLLVPLCPIMYGVFQTLLDMFRRVHNMYPHTIMYFVSCTLDLCSPYVASKMTNSKLVPKNPKFPRKTKIFQKSQIFPKKPKMPKFDKKPNFWIVLAFLALFWLFWKILDFM